MVSSTEPHLLHTSSRYGTISHYSCEKCLSEAGLALGSRGRNFEKQASGGLVYLRILKVMGLPTQQPTMKRPQAEQMKYQSVIRKALKALLLISSRLIYTFSERRSCYFTRRVLSVPCSERMEVRISIVERRF